MRWRRRWHQFQYWLEDSNFLSSGFLTGLPAFGGAILIVVVCLLANQAHSTNRHVPRYATAVANAASNPKTQQLFLRKLISCEPKNAAYKFAMVTNTGFDPESAQRVIRQLAPDDGHGFAPAHLMRATLISRKSILTLGDLSLIKHHAREALAGKLTTTADPETAVAEAHGLLGYALARGDNNEEALPHLQKAAEILRQYRLPAARLSAMLGDQETAERYGRMAEQEYRRLMLEDPADVAMRLEYVQSQLFLRNYPEADRALAEGDFRDCNEPIRQLLIRIYLALWDLRVDESPESIGNRIRLLQRALLVHPQHSGVLHRLTKTVIDDSAGANIARRILRQQLVSGEAPASVHLMLGLAALRAKDSESATFHLQQANSLDPNNQKTTAALALSHARSGPQGLQKSRDLIDSLPPTAFDDPEILGIRGHVRLAEDQVNQAISDLEAALQEIPDSLDLREALADAYTRLGKSDLAKMHDDMLTTRRSRPAFEPVIEPSIAKTPDLSRPSESPAHPLDTISTNSAAASVGPSVLPQDVLSKRLTISHSRTVQNRVNPAVLSKPGFHRDMGS